MTDDTDDATTVLVVDDEPDLVSLYAAWLDERYDVRTAGDGEEAIERLDEAIDVVLLDRRMPGTNGDDVLETIERKRLNCRVAMITAVDPDLDIVDMPFDDYLVKPVDRETLCSMVDVLLERKQYDERSQEFFALASKKAALEATGTEQQSSPEYREITERMDELRSSIDATLEDLGPEGYEAAFHELQ